MAIHVQLPDRMCEGGGTCMSKYSRNALKCAERTHALASSAAGTDVTKAAFISGALRELGVTLCGE
jgi:hypothetical protein